MEWAPPLNFDKIDQESSSSSDVDEVHALELMHKALETEGRRERAIARPINARWPDGVVPYQIQKGFTKLQVDEIMLGMQNIMNSTCITFRKVTADDPDWMDIFFEEADGKKATGCFANARYYGPNHGRHRVD